MELNSKQEMQKRAIQLRGYFAGHDSLQPTLWEEELRIANRVVTLIESEKPGAVEVQNLLNILSCHDRHGTGWYELYLTFSQWAKASGFKVQIY